MIKAVRTNIEWNRYSEEHNFSSSLMGNTIIKGMLAEVACLVGSEDLEFDPSSPSVVDVFPLNKLGLSP